MSIEEIKDILGIDIRDRCRNEVNILLKTIYIVENRGKTLMELGEELGITYCSVYNLKKKYLSKTNKEEMVIVKKAYYEKDPSYLDEIAKLKVLIHRNTRSVAVKSEVSQRKMSMINICDILRDDKKSYLNNKLVSSWNLLDWDNLKSINESKYISYEQ
jgi:hypothetical protein